MAREETDCTKFILDLNLQVVAVGHSVSIRTETAAEDFDHLLGRGPRAACVCGGFNQPVEILILKIHIIRPLGPVSLRSS